MKGQKKFRFICLFFFLCGRCSTISIIIDFKSSFLSALSLVVSAYDRRLSGSNWYSHISIRLTYSLISDTASADGYNKSWEPRSYHHLSARATTVRCILFLPRIIACHTSIMSTCMSAKFPEIIDSPRKKHSLWEQRGYGLYLFINARSTNELSFNSFY